MIDLCEQWLIEHGFDEGQLEGRGFNGNTPLLQAALEGNMMIVSHLLDAGASLYSVNDDYNGVLFNACYANDPQLIRLLVERGADIDDVNEDGETALMYAVSASSGFSAIDYAVDRTVFDQLRYA